MEGVVERDGKSAVWRDWKEGVRIRKNEERGVCRGSINEKLENRGK